MSNKKAVCFGEVLYDVFPDQKKIGGAPLNVALGLKALGLDTQMISCVGADADGDELLSFIDGHGIPTALISQDATYPTGSVQVALDGEGNATYTIVREVAWDYIATNPQLEAAVAQSDFFVFGSLVCRNSQSRKTLFHLVEIAPYAVFDLNLRPPFYEWNTIKYLLEKADFIKCNAEELQFLADYYGFSSQNLKGQVQALLTATGAKSCCVTLGSEGAILEHKGHYFEQKGFPVTVVDTVGAGDAFLATLLAGLFKNIPTRTALEQATAMGGLVAGEAGANPVIPETELLRWIAKNKL